MDPVSPVIEGQQDFEVVYAKDQPEYLPLPTLRTENTLLTRWRLSDEERQHIASGGDLFIVVAHFGGPLQPILPVAQPPDAVMDLLIATTNRS